MFQSVLKNHQKYRHSQYPPNDTTMSKTPQPRKTPLEKSVAQVGSGSMDRRKAYNYLKRVFLRNGYLKIKDSDLASTYGTQVYKKGYEVRLVPNDDAELALVRKAIAALDLYVANSYHSNSRIIQPIYGKDITLKFYALKDKMLH